MLDYKKIYQLIYIDKTIHSYNQALELLKEREIGLEEAIRCLFLKDVYYRLKEKDSAIEYGHLVHNYATKFFEKQEIVDNTILCNQCDIIKRTLLVKGKCDIVFSCFVSETVNIFSIKLQNKDYETKDVLLEDLKKILEEKYGSKTREERYFYYEAVAKKICNQIKDNFSDELYEKLIINISKKA